jgi:hypothetical protein
VVKRLIFMLALATGCGSFEAASIVLDLRPLAIVADPPEVVVDFDVEQPDQIPDLPRVTVRALLADPRENRRLDFRYRICAETQSRRCDEPDTIILLAGEGTIEDPELTASTADATIEVNALLLEEALRLDDLQGFGGIGVQVELRVVPEGGSEADAIYAAKRIIYAPRIPASRVPNQNPHFSVLTADLVDFPGTRCDDPDGVPLVVAPDQQIILEPSEPEGIREPYVLPTLDGGSREFVENIRYSWFATAGDWTSEETGGPKDLFGNVPVLFTKWRAPDGDGLTALEERTGGRVDLWVVQRDERGGTSFLRRCVRVVR